MSDKPLVGEIECPHCGKTINLQYTVPPEIESDETKELRERVAALETELGSLKDARSGSGSNVEEASGAGNNADASDPDGL